MGDLYADPGDWGPADAMVELAGPEEPGIDPWSHHGPASSTQRHFTADLHCDSICALCTGNSQHSICVLHSWRTDKDPHSFRTGKHMK